MKKFKISEICNRCQHSTVYVRDSNWKDTSFYKESKGICLVPFRELVDFYTPDNTLLPSTIELPEDCPYVLEKILERQR